MSSSIPSISSVRVTETWDKEAIKASMRASANASIDRAAPYVVAGIRIGAGLLLQVGTSTAATALKVPIANNFPQASGIANPTIAVVGSLGISVISNVAAPIITAGVKKAIPLVKASAGCSINVGVECYAVSRSCC